MFSSLGEQLRCFFDTTELLRVSVFLNFISDLCKKSRRYDSTCCDNCFAILWCWDSGSVSESMADVL